MIRYEVKDNVAIVTLDRPEKLNALLTEMRQALAMHFEQAAQDDKVRSVLLRGEGRARREGSPVARPRDPRRCRR